MHKQLVIVLLFVLFAQAFFSSFFLSATSDEYPHIESGYSALVTGDFRMETEHPPLVKVLSALPLLFWGLEFPKEHESWAEKRHFVFYKQFVFGVNGEKARKILLVARLPMMLIALCLALALYLFCKKKYGTSAGLFALFLVVFEPTILSQSNLVMTDLGFTLACFAYVAVLYLFLQRPSKSLFLWVIIIFGIAQLTKFTAVFLVPLTVILLLAHHFFRPLSFPCKSVLLNNVVLLAALGLSGLFFINSAYLFDNNFRSLEQMFLSDLSIDKELYSPETFVRNSVERFIFSRVPVPLPYYYLKGLAYVTIESKSAHPNFLFGRVSERGFLSYYGWSLLLKTPLPLLLLVCVAIVVVLCSRKSSQKISGGKNAVGGKSDIVFFLIPILFFLAAFSFGSKQNGVRYLLEVYPFFIVLAASVFKIVFRMRLLVGIFAVWYVMGTLLAFPNYIAYHNELVQDSVWPYVFSDTNVELGQNLDALTEYLLDRNFTQARVAYFQKEDVRKYWPYQFPPLGNCTAGIAVVDTVGLHVNPEFSYLRCLSPVDRIRNSIFVFNVTKCR